jgi:hypothetical protein
LLLWVVVGLEVVASLALQALDCAFEDLERELRGSELHGV